MAITLTRGSASERPLLRLMPPLSFLNPWFSTKSYKIITPAIEGPSVLYAFISFVITLFLRVANYSALPMTNILAKVAILWLPSVALSTIVSYRIFTFYPHSKLDSAYWKFPEWPALSLWIPILLRQICALFHCGKQLSNIKVTMFWSLFLTTFAIRCLTLLSALCSSVDSTSDPLMLPMYSTSPWKPFLLYVLCDGSVSDCVNLIKSQRYPSNETSRLVSFSWRILVVRLGFVHTIDSFIHVIWLRYFYENGPYTAHINNSELLRMMLIVQSLLYSYKHRHTNSKHHNEVDVANDGKDEVRDPAQKENKILGTTVV